LLFDNFNAAPVIQQASGPINLTTFVLNSHTIGAELVEGAFPATFVGGWGATLKALDIWLMLLTEAFNVYPVPVVSIPRSEKVATPVAPVVCVSVPESVPAPDPSWIVIAKKGRPVPELSFAWT